MNDGKYPDGAVPNQWYYGCSVLEHQNSHLNQCANEAWLDSVKTSHRMAIKEQEASLAIHKEMVKSQLAETRMLNRELSLKALVESSDGALCIENVDPQGIVKVSQPVTNIREIRSELYVSANRDRNPNVSDVLRIVWSGEAEGVYVPMDDKNLEQTIMQRLRSKGAFFKFPRRIKGELQSHFVGWLLRKAVKVEILEHIGWNQLLDGAWRFEANPKRTLRGLNKE